MTSKNIRVFTAVFLLLFSVWVAAEQNERNQGDYAYNIGPKDLLKIMVFEVPELNITARVAENGSITLPLLGVVQVEGLTLRGVEKKLAELLEKSYLKNAQVTVFIQEYQSKTVSVMGAVKNPGNYELLGKQNLMQVLSKAGGLTDNAGDRIIVIRSLPSGQSASLTIELDDLMMRGNPKLNIPLTSGDIINVPVERYYDVYVFGQVERPGSIKIKRSPKMTLMKAIAQAGGFTRRARKSAVVITRVVKDKEVKIKVNAKKILKGRKPDFELLPDDVIFVPESLL